MKTSYQLFKRPDLNKVNLPSDLFFVLPNKNPLIPEDFTIFGDKQEVNLKQRNLSNGNSAIDLWYVQDRVYQMPRVIV